MRGSGPGGAGAGIIAFRGFPRGCGVPEGIADGGGGAGYRYVVANQTPGIVCRDCANVIGIGNGNGAAVDTEQTTSKAISHGSVSAASAPVGVIGGDAAQRI